MTANKSITIGDVVVNPGKRVSINLPVADLYTSTSLHMPVKAICGRKAGPVLFVSAAVHGDELNGVEIIRRLLRLKGISLNTWNTVGGADRQRARVPGPVTLPAGPA